MATSFVAMDAATAMNQSLNSSRALCLSFLHGALHLVSLDINARLLEFDLDGLRKEMMSEAGSSSVN